MKNDPFFCETCKAYFTFRELWNGLFILFSQKRDLYHIQNRRLRERNRFEPYNRDWLGVWWLAELPLWETNMADETEEQQHNFWLVRLMWRVSGENISSSIKLWSRQWNSKSVSRTLHVSGEKSERNDVNGKSVSRRGFHIFDCSHSLQRDMVPRYTHHLPIDSNFYT